MTESPHSQIFNEISNLGKKFRVRKVDENERVLSLMAKILFQIVSIGEVE